MMILAQCAVISSTNRTNVLGHHTGVGGDCDGGHHKERADGDQEQLEEDHLGAGQ